METVKKFAGRWGPAVVMMAVIYLASDTPGDSLPRFGLWDALVKKGGHALGYALLALAYGRGLADGGPFTRRQGAAAVGLAVAYAVTDEAHQAFTAGRTPSPVDVVIDAAGAVAGVAAGWWATARRGRPVRPDRRGS